MARACQRCSYSNQDEAKFCLQCGAMLEVEVVDAGDPLIGKILLGRYRVVRVLGEGGMGKVYLAEQKMGTATRKVAIKTLHQELIADPQLVARFHRECETVIELHHPNTVQFYDFGELEDKTLFIVMEFIEGEDLAHRLQRGPIDPQTADKLLIQVCGSLHEAHQRGIVHRDLKPENVLLTSRGGQSDFVKVLDFGIAKRSEAEDESKAKLTKQGMVLGTPPYMSPEQFSGQTLDLRSDIYSLGIMTYEMITGHLPFEAKTPWEWATKHLTQAPTPIDAFPQGAALPQNKKNAIMRALQKSRDDRHPDVLSFMHEFTGIGDAQAAWTMATSLSSGGGSGGHGSQPNFLPPVVSSQGTPVPSHASSSHGGTPVPMTQQATPSLFGAPIHPQPTPTPGPTDFSSVSMSQIPGASSGGTGKWVALLLVVFVLLGGAVGGGLWWWNSKKAIAAGPGVGPVSLDPNNPNVGNPNVNNVGNPNVGTTIGTPVGVDPNSTMLPVGVEPNMLPVGVEPPTMVEVPIETTMDPVEVAMVETPSRMTGEEESNPAADRAIARGRAAIGNGNLAGAIDALREAQRLVGRTHSSLRPLRNAIAERGAREVGFKVVNQCSQAQALFRDLRSVGADGPSRDQFFGGCTRP